ncbi:alpha-ketoglutarate-dependent dioxygenase alkB homolog 6-like isoform X1 [Amphiura filiformis]|uniref:alpha-ketoglutarate-dependent dioxygenase alkB homolog 6-like isoform X1 n=1 Tax=Amphiura filiformis TaxID=82378 RepID=UPI003B21BC89
MATTQALDLSKYKVKDAPDTAYYIPYFVTNEEGKYLWDQVYGAPKPKWTQLSNRRLQNWGGLPHPKGMVAENLPKWLDVYSRKIAGLGVFDDKVPNHVLVNEYQAGQGIMPHEDGPLFYPVVTTISLGTHTLLDFYHHRRDSDQTSSLQQQSNHTTSTTQMPGDGDIKFSLLLEPNSLLILKDSMYTSYLHGITERKEDTVSDQVANLPVISYQDGDKLERTCRISLTIRYVPKTLKIQLKLGKR